MSDPAELAGASPGMPPDVRRGAPPSTVVSMVYPDVYLPEALARAVAERAMAAQVSPSALLASLLERYVREHASEMQASDLTDAEAGGPEDDWDAPGMVRRIVPLSEQLAQAVTQLALRRRRSVNALIGDIVQAAMEERGDVP
jgi:hypothetical protein